MYAKLGKICPEVKLKFLTNHDLFNFEMGNQNHIPLRRIEK